MRLLLFALAATCSVVSLTAQQRAISDSDLFAFRWVASPQISPDGRQAAYVLVTVNAKHDGYETSVWLVATDGASPPRRLTAGPKDGGPRWSPDGTTLAFLRSKDGRQQLHLLPLAGGEARQLTDLAKGASPAAWSPDGKTIAFTSTTTPEDLAKKGKSEEPKSDVRIITQAEFRGDDEGYFDPAEHTHIWTVPAGMPGDEPATARQVTSGPFDENAPQWSRDGARIYFVSDRVPESYYYPPDNNVYSVPAAGGALDTVVDINGPVFGPAPPRGGEGSSPNIWTADGRSVIVATTEHGRSNLVRFDAQTGAREPLTTGDHAVLAYTASADAKSLALTIGDPTHLPDLYVLDAATKGVRRLTHVNDSLFAQLALVTPEDFWYTSFDGRKIETWIMKP